MKTLICLVAACLVIAVKCGNLRARRTGGNLFHRIPITNEAPIYRAPIYQAPIYQAPIYQAPTYQAPIYQAPTYQAPHYQAPEHRHVVYQAPPIYSPLRPKVYADPVQIVLAQQTPLYNTAAADISEPAVTQYQTIEQVPVRQANEDAVIIQNAELATPEVQVVDVAEPNFLQFETVENEPVQQGFVIENTEEVTPEVQVADVAESTLPQFEAIENEPVRNEDPDVIQNFEIPPPEFQFPPYYGSTYPENEEVPFQLEIEHQFVQNSQPIFAHHETIEDILVQQAFQQAHHVTEPTLPQFETVHDTFEDSADIQNPAAEFHLDVPSEFEPTFSEYQTVEEVESVAHQISDVPAVQDFDSTFDQQEPLHDLDSYDVAEDPVIIHTSDVITSDFQARIQDPTSDRYEPVEENPVPLISEAVVTEIWPMIAEEDLFPPVFQSFEPVLTQNEYETY